MEFEFKITVNGVCSNGLTTSAEVRSIVSKENVLDALGKLLYSIESMGYDFTTGDVYDEVAAKVDLDKVDSRFYKLHKISTENLTMELTLRCRAM